MSLTDALLREAYPLDVWIVLRTDGAKGSGTENDPYDGSVVAATAVPVTSPITNVLREATVTTAVSHGYADGDVVAISGVTDPLYNGAFVIYGVTSNQFKYYLPSAPGGSGSGSAILSARQIFRLDDRMRETAANTAIHVGPGLFQTRGYGCGNAAIDWKPKNGQKIRGSGIGVTTLKLVYVSKPNLPFHAIGGDYANYLDSLEVSDLTVDCNLPGQAVLHDQTDGKEFAQVACGAVYSVGKHIRLRRIRAINFGTQASGVECFVLVSGGAHANLEAEQPPKVVYDCVIEDCIVERPSPNNVRETTCILMNVSERGPVVPPDNLDGLAAYHRGCVVRNCVVDCEYKANPVSIASIVINTGVATVTTRQPHGRQDGDWVRISGAIVNGSTNNSFNGSYTISNSTTFSFTYNPSTPAPTSNPTGDIWVGRWPSHYVPISDISPWDTITHLVTVTTLTPHFVIKDGQAAITNVNYPNSSGYNGTFKVQDVLDWKRFTYSLPSDPGAHGALGNAIVGVNFQAVTIDGGSEAVMEGCHILNCGYGGPYHDTWSSKDLIVRNNHYRAVLTGPYQFMGRVGGFIKAASLTHGDPDDYTAKFTINSSLPHGFTVGQAVRITAYKLENGNPIPNDTYNGVFAIKSVPTDQSFTYTMLSIPEDNVDVGTTPPPTVEALWQVGQCIIENNIIELIPHFNNWGPPKGIGFSGAFEFGTFSSFRIWRRAVIRNNVIRYVDSLTEGTAYNQGINFNACEDVLVENNVIDLLSSSPIGYGGCTSVRCFNNRDPSGKLIQGVVGTAKQDELTTFIEDAAILSIL